MAKRTDTSSELVNAAEALDAELNRFEDASTSLRKLSLNSQKNLERATRSLNELAEVEESLGKQVQVLVAAIAGVRERQLAQVEEVRVKAEEIKSRSVTFQQLLEQFKVLGAGAAGLNERLQKVTPGEGNSLTELFEEMGELAAKAQSLAELAGEQDYDDVARLADGLRQQLLSVRGKLKQLDTRLPS